MGQVSSRVRESGLILGGLGVLGFIGVVWLMIYGNLSGNLGFGQDSELTPLQELTLDNLTAITLTGTSGRVNPSVSSVVVINATGGETITSGNYTLTDTTIIGSDTMTVSYNNTAVNVSYTTTFDSTGLINTEAVIDNVTGGFGTFFEFSNTFFTIAAIVLLIFMLVGLLAIVMTIAEGRGGKGSGFAGQ